MHLHRYESVVKVIAIPTRPGSPCTRRARSTAPLSAQPRSLPARSLRSARRAPRWSDLARRRAHSIDNTDMLQPKHRRVQTNNGTTSGPGGSWAAATPANTKQPHTQWQQRARTSSLVGSRIREDVSAPDLPKSGAAHRAFTVAAQKTASPCSAHHRG